MAGQVQAAGLREPRGLVELALSAIGDGVSPYTFAAEVVEGFEDLARAAGSEPDRMGCLRAADRVLSEAQAHARRNEWTGSAYLRSACGSVRRALLLAELRSVGL